MPRSRASAWKLMVCFEFFRICKRARRMRVSIFSTVIAQACQDARDNLRGLCGDNMFEPRDLDLRGFGNFDEQS